MIGHIRLCLDEIEAEIDAADFAVVGARARELLAEHIEGIRAVVDTVEAAGSRLAPPNAERVSPAAEASPVMPRAA